MKESDPSERKAALPASLEQLHATSRTWLSEIEFWNQELIFFQKLLYQYSNQALSEEDKRHWERLNNRLLYLEGEVLRDMATEIRDHERELGELMRAGESLDESHYRRVHETLEVKIEAYEGEFKLLKTEVFVFAERLFKFDDKTGLPGSQNMYSWL